MRLHVETLLTERQPQAGLRSLIEPGTGLQVLKRASVHKLGSGHGFDISKGL